jgi:phosphoribosylformylglycinamidine synthase subunit PurS
VSVKDICSKKKQGHALPSETGERPMKARVHVMLKNGVLDPQGEAVRHALGTLGFAGVQSVRQGKVIELELASTDADAARAEVGRMCEAILANTVIESYTVEII